MYKKFVLAGASLALVTLGGVSAFAETADVKPVPTAGTTMNAATKIACVGAAVNTREAALVTAMTAFTGATNAAHASRAAALQQAYTGTTTKAVGASVKTAWSAFDSSMKTARKAWQTARNAAWTAYRTTAVACKAPNGTGDGVHSSSEVSGS